MTQSTSQTNQIPSVVINHAGQAPGVEITLGGQGIQPSVQINLGRQPTAQVSPTSRLRSVFSRDTLYSYVNPSHFNTLKTRLRAYLYRCWEWLKSFLPKEKPIDPALLEKWKTAITNTLIAAPSDQQTTMAGHLVNAAARMEIEPPFKRILIADKRNQQRLFTTLGQGEGLYRYYLRLDSAETLIIVTTTKEDQNKMANDDSIKSSIIEPLKAEYRKSYHNIDNAVFFVLNQKETDLLSRGKMPYRLEGFFQIKNIKPSQPGTPNAASRLPQ